MDEFHLEWMVKLCAAKNNYFVLHFHAHTHFYLHINKHTNIAIFGEKMIMFSCEFFILYFDRVSCLNKLLVLLLQSSTLREGNRVVVHLVKIGTDQDTLVSLLFSFSQLPKTKQNKKP